MNGEIFNNEVLGRPATAADSGEIPMVLGLGPSEGDDRGAGKEFWRPRRAPSRGAARGMRSPALRGGNAASRGLRGPVRPKAARAWKITVAICLGLLGAIVITKQLLEWDVALARLHPALRYAAWACVGLLVVMLVVLVYRRLKRYLQLHSIATLRATPEQDRSR